MPSGFRGPVPFGTTGQAGLACHIRLPLCHERFGQSHRQSTHMAIVLELLDEFKNILI
jgi:hypothetical protein